MTAITFDDIKKKYETKLQKDEEVSCKVLLKLKDGYLVCINDEWEGFIPNTHFIEEEANTNEIKALVLSGPDKNENYLVSPRVLKENITWQNLEKHKQDETPIKVTISKVIKGGAEVFIDTLRAFLPGRYIRLIGMPQENWVNQEIDVLIEELDKKEKKIILNHKKAVEKDRDKKANEALGNLREGSIVKTKVLRIADFGVFVDLGGIDGLIPASELSWKRYSHPKEVVKVGQELQALVFRIEKDTKKVALSVKQLLGDPWEQVKNRIGVGMLIHGTILSEAPFGLFVELMPGVEALLHNSEIPEGIEKPKIGSEIVARLIRIDLNDRKVGLSLKDINLENEPEKQIETNGHIKDYDSEFEIASVSLEDFALCNTEGEKNILSN